MAISDKLLVVSGDHVSILTQQTEL